MREFYRERHIVFRFVGRIAVYYALIACAQFRSVYGGGYISALFVDAYLDLDVRRIVTDLRHNRTRYVFVVHVGCGRYLAADEALIVRQHNLASHTAVLVLLQAFVKNAVGNEVGKFIGMSARYGLGCVNAFRHIFSLTFYVIFDTILLSRCVSTPTACQTPFVH